MCARQLPTPLAAAQTLAQGLPVIFPTETVYGIGVSLRQPQAAARIYALKSRPHTMPLMLHVLGAEAIAQFGRPANADAVRSLAAAFWPGPLTLIVPARDEVPREFLGGGDTVALRAPDHARTRELLRALAEVEGGPTAIAGTSANVHGEAPPTNEDAAARAFGTPEPPWLAGGSCSVGVASTVLRVDGEGLRVLRAGKISAQQIFEVCGLRVED